MKVAVILPTYNERESIAAMLEKISIAARQTTRHEISIIVVDDNSPDGTQDVVRAYQKKNQRVHLLTGKKEGLGRALLRGMTYAVEKLKADVITQMDADLSHDPAVFPQFLAAIDAGADFVVGSRYIPGGSIPGNWAPHRKLFSVVGNAIVRFGLGHLSVHDWTGGYRAYKRKFFEAARHELASFSGYVFQIAFLHKSVLRGARVTEVPIHFTDRRFGHSKIAPAEYIKNVIDYVVRARFKSIWTGRFGKFAVVGTIGFIINTIVLELLVLLGAHPWVGSATGAEIAIVSNFILNSVWTFRDRRISGGKTVAKFLQFNTTSFGAIVIQAGTVWMGTVLFGVGMYRLFYILGVGLGLTWNYIMYSRMIWRKENSK